MIGDDMPSLDEMIEYEETFSKIDKDNDGKITYKELVTALKSRNINLTKEELDCEISKMDENKDGEIDFEEFINQMPKKPQPETKKVNLYDIFLTLDKDNDGFISHDELRSVMKEYGTKLSDQEIDNIITVADVDKDKKIDYLEFHEILRFHSDFSEGTK